MVDLEVGEDLLCGVCLCGVLCIDCGLDDVVCFVFGVGGV